MRSAHGRKKIKGFLVGSHASWSASVSLYNGKILCRIRKACLWHQNENLYRGLDRQEATVKSLNFLYFNCARRKKHLYCNLNKLNISFRPNFYWWHAWGLMNARAVAQGKLTKFYSFWGGGGRNSNKRNVFYVINLCWKLRIFYFFFPKTVKTVGREQIYMFTQLIHDIIGRIWERGPRIRIGALGPLSLWSREWFANKLYIFLF